MDSIFKGQGEKMRETDGTWAGYDITVNRNPVDGTFEVTFNKGFMTPGRNHDGTIHRQANPAFVIVKFGENEKVPEMVSYFAEEGQDLEYKKDEHRDKAIKRVLEEVRGLGR